MVVKFRRVLDAFANSKFHGVKYEYATGGSGSPVFVAHYKPRNQYGLDGTFIVKVGSEEWATKEQNFYENLPANFRSSPLLIHSHMRSNSVDGQAAVAYDVAFNAVIKSKTLMSILDKREVSEEEAQKQIKELTHALVTWHLKGNGANESIIEAPYALLSRMLTAKRTQDLLERLGRALPFWSPDAPHIRVDGRDRLLPNPLAYKAICEKLTYSPNCPIGYVHGDLHTGNVICFLESQELPKLIDFEQAVPNGVPLFDLAYLEFDIMCHLLAVEQQKDRQDWLTLLDYSMAEIYPSNQIASWGASRAWTFLKPIREEVLQLQQTGGEDYEVVWWLSTVAVGLNFARKSSQTRLERVASLLYAAFGLDRLLKLFEMKELTTREFALFVPWIQGDFPSLAPSEASPLAPSQEKSPELPVREKAQPVPANSPSLASEVVPTQTHPNVPVEHDQPPALKPLTEPSKSHFPRSFSSMDFDPELGLRQLQDMFKDRSSSSFRDFLLLEARLRQNLQDRRRYGDTPTSKAERAQVIDVLNQLTFEEFGISFNELCQPPHQD